MKVFPKEELIKILENHRLWLAKKEGERADLQGADLQRANLQWANLQWADLQGAKLPSPTMLLLCHWGEVKEELCAELMRYDASNHPDPSKFDEWAKGGRCPYVGGFARCANFKEKRELWSPGAPKSALELVLLLFEEKGIKHTGGKE